MNNLLPLMLREWMQHKFAWSMMVLVPVALAVLGLGVGTIQLDEEMTAMPIPQLALMVGSISMVLSVTVLLLILGVTAIFTTINSPRRDDADRSTEFWLSMPSGHAESLLAPMLVHLILVPVAALFIGLVAAFPVSMVVVGRVAGLGAWFSLPWGDLLGALLAGVLRVAVGLPLAMLWMLPLVLAAMLTNALARRWGLPLLALALGTGGWILERVFGQPLLLDTLARMGHMAALSLAGASSVGGVKMGPEDSPDVILGLLPGLALKDFGAALGLMAQPLFLGTLAASALLFGALLLWRRRGTVGG